MRLRSDLVNNAAVRRISRHWRIALGQGQILSALISQFLEKYNDIIKKNIVKLANSNYSVHFEWSKYIGLQKV